MTEAETVAAICAWLRSHEQTGVAHTHTIAKELERGDWREHAAEQRQRPDSDG